ncbi:MAG: glycosyltransferase [Candidatus Omnitrophica bacterium]|nr:glycosyltransferase [Candidatus Omnitrophota bacterium]MDD5552649.1 glycosyltransferase [Candidatus Omnitrophota bacterium]
MKEKISVVMPAYNESAHINSSIEETVKAFESFGYSWELIVLDDGSTDDTFERALRFAEKYPQLTVKKNPYNLGKGRAIKKAMHYVSGDYVLFLDADLDLHPNQFPALFDIMRLNNADIVIGSKLHPNSVVDYPLQRKLISWIYYLTVRALFNLPCHDTQTGLKLFRAQVLRDVMPRILVKAFAFDLEILVNAHHLGYKITEAPIVITKRRNYGRIGPQAILRAGLDTLAIFYRMYILRYYDRIDYYRRKNLAKEFRRMRR